MTNFGRTQACQELIINRIEIIEQLHNNEITL